MKIRTISGGSAGWFSFLLLLVTCAGCTEENAIPAGGERVEVKLDLSLSAPVNGVPQTRAGSADFYNLWAFQFDASGKIVGTPQQLSNSQTPVGEGRNLTVSLGVGQNQTVYLFSAGKKLAVVLSDIKTRQELENYKLDYITSAGGGYTSAVVNPEDMPYAGCIEGANVISLGQGAGMLEYNSPEGFSGSIAMKQLMAKVTLRYRYEAETHTLQGVRLQNVVAHATVAKQPAYTPDNGTEFRLFNLQLGAPDAQGYYTASWYVGQNLQGTNPAIISEMDRYYKEGMNLAPQYGLCFEVLGKNKLKATEYSVHRIFIGNNNTTNFDVEANHHYTLTTEFASAYNDGNTDPRLDVTEFASASVELYASDRIKTTLSGKSPANSSYDLDAHYDFRPVTVVASGCSVELGIYTDRACTNLAQPGNKEQNWLQISTEPNYTLAVNNHTAPLTNRMQVDVRAPSKLKFYLYNDEYVDVQPDNNSPKRSLYVKITTTELDVSAPKVTTDIFRMDQRPIWIMGKYGGMQRTDGSYERWVGMDYISEHNVKYSSETEAVKNVLPWGYAKSVDYYQNDDSWMNGLETTIRFAENPKDYTEASSGITLPLKTGGKVNLYQYTYYNVYHARYCYDRNRDLDGNGVLENPNSRGENEIKWYTPGGNQLLGAWMEARLLPISGTSMPCFEGEPGAMNNRGRLISTVMAYTAAVRCVRDMPVGTLPSPTIAMEDVPYTDGSGSRSYPVITSPQGVDRSTQNDFYTMVTLYTDDTGNTKVYDENGDPKQVKRIKRHKTDDPINSLSRKFAVSPVMPPVKVTWMRAGGWAENASAADPTDMAVDDGCPVYRGMDDKDAPGTWRLPTQRELALFGILRKALSQVGGTDFASTARVWGCTESYTYGWSISGGATTVWLYDDVSKTSKLNYRCVRDLP